MKQRIIKTANFIDGVKQLQAAPERGGAFPPIMELTGESWALFWKFLLEYVPILEPCTIEREYEGFGFWGEEKMDISTLSINAAGSAQWLRTDGNDPSAPTECTFSETDNLIGGLRAAILVSNKQLTQFPKGTERFLLRHSARLLGKAVQLAILNGAGSATDPVTGIYQTSGLAKDSFSSNYYTELVDTIKALKTSGIAVNGFACSPREEQSLRKQTDSGNSYIFKPSEPLVVNGVPGYVCSELPVNLGGGTNESFILNGDWRSAVCIMPMVGIMRDPYSRFLENQTRFIAFMWFGVSIENVSDFRCLDAIT